MARGVFKTTEGVQEIQAVGDGIVTQVNVKEGDFVQKGDCLYSFNKELEKNLLEMIKEKEERALYLKDKGKDINSLKPLKRGKSTLYPACRVDKKEVSVGIPDCCVNLAKNRYFFFASLLPGSVPRKLCSHQR